MGTPKTAQPAATQDGDLLPLAEAGNVLDISRSTMYRLMETGKLRGFKVGRQWRFRRGDLEAYLHRRPASFSEPPEAELAAELAFFIDGVDLEKWPVTCDGAEPVTEKGDGGLHALVSLIICHAFVSRASDIHLDPFGKGKDAHVLLRLRIDGVLQEVRRFSSALGKALAAAFKELAGLDLLETRLPQDGRIAADIGDRRLGILLASVPSFFGETLTGRITDANSIRLSLDDLNLPQDTRERFDGWLGRRHGLVLTTGPTMSGKTTVLYALAREVTTPGVKVVSIENPIHYVLPGTIQLQLNEKIGYTPVNGIQSAMRLDPDVLIVGDICDRDMLHACCQAAMTGHLVLAQMHADDAVSVLTRFRDWDIEPFLLTSALTGISCQRLVRLLCPHCRQPVALPESVVERTRRNAAEGGYALPQELSPMGPVGCEQCSGGYRRRTGIYEQLEVGDAVRDALLAGKTGDELRRVAVENGMRTLAADAARVTADGTTSAQEAFRALNG
ncbi:MAG: type II/IV secretion system protein [Lentisphaerae bacterium]|jgi:general secretion pathway protein E|nr:type II/IV secretion system protein [Lentisphaerota bacterium]MBT4821355.1 type II/IV secretion system protein [Lentisphaerota bacterium]MBT5612559.1 type II/IV secretion system protein [Lentisphaerota bacterium]MBT7061354.1 type II/IV secretion system protein [Lentisphaerota bacterium]MBT7840495.1 type II/IV secretion system protein [Lentisphaerota bacterium]